MVDLGVWKEEKDQRRKYESSRASVKCTTMSPRRFICDLMQAALLMVSSIPIQTEGGKEADFEAAMNAAGSDGEGEGSSEKSAPTRGPSSAQRGGQAQSGGGSGDDDFAAALEAATAAETVRKQQGGQAESGGSSGHDDFAAAEAERRRAREESRRLEARSSDSVQDDIFRSESGERGSAVTSGGPGIQAGSQAGR